MKLPWNKNYLIISFHIIVTIITLCVLTGLIFQITEAKNVVLSTIHNFFIIFSPLFFGIFFSVLLDPITKLFQKHISLRVQKQSTARKIATLFTLLTTLSVLSFLIFFASKSVGGVNLQLIQQQLSAYISKLGDFLVLINIKLAQWGLLHNMEDILSAWTVGTIKFMEDSIFKIGSTLPNIGNRFLDIFLGFVISIYILLEKSTILQLCNDISLTFFGENKTSNLKIFFSTIHNIFIGYLGGQFIDAIIMAILFSITFLIIGLPYGVVLGIFSGFSNIIPYFGSIVAFFLSISSAFLTGDTSKILYAIVSILVLQQIDSIFIVPRVVGKKVELHPIIVILSLTVFGRLFGFIGLLLAVPLGAFTKTVFMWLYNRQKYNLNLR